MKSINSKAFEGLPKINSIYLWNNICINTWKFRASIDEDFGPFWKIIDDSCGYIESKFTDCGTTSYSVGQIVEGTEAKPGQWPFMAALVMKANKEFFCGGNLITKRHVLTGESRAFIYWNVP